MSGLPVIDLHHAQHLTWLLLHSCCQQKHCLVESDDCHIHSYLLLENVETTDNETAFHGNKAMAVTRIEPGRMIQNNQTRFSLRKWITLVDATFATLYPRNPPNLVDFPLPVSQEPSNQFRKPVDLVVCNKVS